ncbi:tRNA (adenosine(37)-N6)-threonylcarbamoyltransferase complex dimerization subunit type 1 TsaB, partial [Gammaproteobacteria bacterium]|nr:tRNA (adenosine(37)-N6)-threonylcarbamoyltransferase complex dimerization subunit type 1 TsaB [Gammaproteobacteria bacterium]
MQSEPTILGFDTSAAHCAAALLKDDKNISTVFTEMQKGQVESLIPILETLLKNNSTTWDNLNAIGVGIGPGNFTGIRISVSA